MSNPIVVHKAKEGKLKQVIETRGLQYFADVAESLGGDASGPDPHDLLDSALGACTALTVTMVARHKKLPLEDIRVTVTHVEASGLYTLNREIELVGALSDEQRQYLLGIANKCPIHKALLGRFEVATSLQPAK